MKQRRFILSGVVLFCLVIGVLFYLKHSRYHKVELAVSYSMSSNKEDQLNFQMDNVKMKEQKLQQIENENPLLYKKFIGMMTQLTDAYKELQSQLENNINREQILGAMIQNLKLQQELLSQQLSIYKNAKSGKNE